MDEVLNEKWRLADADEIEIVLSAERKHFGSNAITYFIIYAVIFIVACFFIACIKNITKRSVEYEKLGYYTDNPPVYTAVYYSDFEYSLEEAKEIYYAEQEKDIAAAEAEAKAEVDGIYNKYYVIAALVCLALALIRIFCLYVRFHRFSVNKLWVCEGTCIGKAYTSFHAHFIHNHKCLADIRWHDGTINKEVKVVPEKTYYEIENEDGLLAVKFENDILEGIYPKKIFEATAV